MLNSETYFSRAATANIERSSFDRSHSLHTDFSTGELVPLMVEPVIPGDTVTMDFSHVTRGATPIAPVMDNAILDITAFFVPNRLIWDHWVNFMGQNDVTHWENPIEYHTPKITAPSGGWNVHSLADYLGVPPGKEVTVNGLRFRGYALIWNTWWRDENLKDPCYITMDETTVTGVNKGANYDYVTDTEAGACCAKVAKLHDMFTSCLPEPQRGPDVYVPLGQEAPIVGVQPTLDPDDYPDYVTQSSLLKKELVAQQVDSNKTYITLSDDSDIGNQMADGIAADKRGLIKLAADLSNAIGATIGQLRMAFQLQRYFEATARTGSRYTEIISGIFHVTSPDARQQRPEFLGSKRFPINIDQVLQTSATDAVSPQGNTGAFSCTVNADSLFTYSATEHGYLYILGCVRTVHTYAQGMDKDLFRDKSTDYYVPQLAHISEQPIYNKEIYCQDDSVVDADGNVVNDQVFGYQEAWAEYRYSPNRCTALMRPQVANNLAIWNYADKYTQLPYLSSEWIDETDANVARTMAVQNQPQWLMNAFFKAKWTRPMPITSIPGLIDHF